jgi:transposase
MAQLIRMGWFRTVHVKTLQAQEIRGLLTARKLLLAKLRDVESSIRGILRGFGLKVGAISTGKLEARIRELAAGQAMLERVTEPLLRARAALGAEYATLHRHLLATVRQDEVCRRLMTVPGVGAVVAMTFRSGIDQPQRFLRSKAVGAHFGLTPKKYQSGEIDRTGRITKVGDAMVRTALFEAAHVILTRSMRFTALKAWGLRVAGRHGMRKAKVALARKLAVVMHRMWVDGTTFRWGEAGASGA